MKKAIIDYSVFIKNLDDDDIIAIINEELDVNDLFFNVDLTKDSKIIDYQFILDYYINKETPSYYRINDGVITFYDSEKNRMKYQLPEDSLDKFEEIELELLEEKEDKILKEVANEAYKRNIDLNGSKITNISESALFNKYFKK